MLISLDRVGKYFADRSVFADVSLQVGEGDRIGLVGANGTGKTTLMRILAGELPFDSGERAARDGLSAGYLKQDSGVDAAHTIYAEMRGVFVPLLDAQREMKELTARMADFSDHATPDYQALQARYGTLESYFSANGGYEMDVRIETVLCGMGFRFTPRDTVCGTLSGGERTRLALAKLLLSDPDILMLDEPTNHLDFDTLEWLEGYLEAFKGALVVISHDRFFLDRLCTRIWDVSEGTVTPYRGNYTKYLETRDQLYERRMKEYEAQQKQVAKLTDYIAQNKARASTANMAKSREKQLERLELVKRPPERPASMKLDLVYRREPVKEVLHVKGLELHAGENGPVLCPALDLELLRGEKVAVVGPNGVGKSTFLKALQDKQAERRGRIRWGQEVRRAYFEQESRDLSPGKTVLAELWDRYPQMREQEVRDVLARLRFTGEAVFRQVGQLSGGEQARLKLALMVLCEANVLLMDEPTNHLDLPAKEALEEALLGYTGTILMVSHDRYLLSHVPTRIVEMRPDGFVSYPGYAAYADARRAATALRDIRAPEQPEKPKDSAGAAAYYGGKKKRAQLAANRTRYKEAEQEISALEAEISARRDALEDPETAKDYQLVQQGYQDLETLQAQLNALVDEWAGLAEELGLD